MVLGWGILANCPYIVYINLVPLSPPYLYIVCLLKGMRSNMQARQQDRDYGQPSLGPAVYRESPEGGLPSGVAGELRRIRRGPAEDRRWVRSRLAEDRFIRGALV